MDCRWRKVPGCVALRAYFEAEGALSQRELAARLGTKEGVIYAWKVGFRRPGPEYRQALARICGIPVDAWLTTAERRAALRLRAA